MVITVVVALVAVAATAALFVLRSAPGPLSVTGPSLLFASASDVRIALGNSHGPVTWTLRARSGEEIASGRNAGGENALCYRRCPRPVSSPSTSPTTATPSA